MEIIPDEANSQRFFSQKKKKTDYLFLMNLMTAMTWMLRGLLSCPTEELSHNQKPFLLASGYDGTIRLETLECNGW